MSDLSPDLTGTTLGSWRLLRRLGEGAFGAVYEARHIVIEGRRAAVKVLHPHLSFHKDIKRRFVTEATVASRAEHENIVQVFDGGATPQGICYVAMELLKGKSLADLILTERRLDVKRTITIGIQLASALQAAHRLGVVHRDLKPDNVFITSIAAQPDFVKVLDFGVAKLQSPDHKTTTGVLMGTPLYMSPEQWQTLPDIDGRADLYAMGAILYECLIGRPPYDGATHFLLMKAHLEHAVPSAAREVSVPAALDALIIRLLAKERAQRPQNAAEVLQILYELSGSKPPAARVEHVESVDPMARTEAPPAPRTSLSLRQQVGELMRKPAIRWAVVGSCVAAGTVTTGIVVSKARLAKKPPAPSLAQMPAPPIAPQPVKPAVNPLLETQYRPKLIALPGAEAGAGRLLFAESEVTQGQFRRLMQVNPSEQHVDSEGRASPCRVRGVGDTLPVFCVSLNEVLQYVNQLSKLEGLSSCYVQNVDLSWSTVPSCTGFRVPTEKEWRYAANAGQPFRYAGSDKLAEVGWYKRNSHGRTQPVKTKRPNAWGLYDMSGNVFEWTIEAFDPPAQKPQGESARVGDGERVVLGGSFYLDEAASALSERRRQLPAIYSTGIGIRILRETRDAVPDDSQSAAQSGQQVPARDAMVHIEGTAAIPSFFMDRTEVSAAAYKACADSGGCSPPSVGENCNGGAPGRVDHPMNCVTFLEAKAYCKWAGKRLPLEAEWELASGGPSGHKYPWGNETPSKQLCWKGTANGRFTCPVGIFPQGGTPAGVFDLAGNVWEWVHSPCPVAGGSAKVRCTSEGEYPVVRGGAGYSDRPNQVGTTARDATVPFDKGFGSIGFRCVRSADPQAP